MARTGRASCLTTQTNSVHKYTTQIRRIPPQIHFCASHALTASSSTSCKKKQIDTFDHPANELQGTFLYLHPDFFFLKSLEISPDALDDGWGGGEA